MMFYWHILYYSFWILNFIVFENKSAEYIVSIIRGWFSQRFLYNLHLTLPVGWFIKNCKIHLPPFLGVKGWTDTHSSVKHFIGKESYIKKKKTSYVQENWTLHFIFWHYTYRLFMLILFMIHRAIPMIAFPWVHIIIIIICHTH